jgi:hypothetical protein
MQKNVAKFMRKSEALSASTRLGIYADYSAESLLHGEARFRTFESVAGYLYPFILHN